MSRMVPPRVTYTSASTIYPEDSTTPRPQTSLSSNGHGNGRPRTGRPKTAASTLLSREQQVICAVSESRGISPVVGLAFVNITTTEAVMCQISDNQTFTRTIHKLVVYEPTELLFMTTAAQPKSKLFSIVELNIPNLRITVIDRKYWSETSGLEYIQQLAFKQDVEAIKVSVGGNFYATCCIAAVGAQNPKSKDCLFGLLNQTLTPMGARLLKSHLLQPSTNADTLEKRYNALDELATREDVFFAVRQALKAFVDVDRILTAITIIPTKPTIQYTEQSINNVIALKQYVKSIPAVFEALALINSELLLHINELCAPERIVDIQRLIDETINEDITYQSQPLDLRNQRTYAIKSGVNGLLDVARQTYKEANADAYQLVTNLGQTHSIPLDMRYDTARQFYIRINTSELEGRNLPDVFINAFRRKTYVECQTLDLLKLNQKIIDSHHEVLQMSDRSVQELINKIREDIAPLFKTCEAIALLDMIASFAQIVTIQDYCRPELTDTFAIKSGRHPIREKIHAEKFVPNDAYATQQTRFQIITGCNMSGKSTYIRSLALMTVMAQIGCFVPATYASFPIRHQLFARVPSDESIEANVSTFASEMRETAFILRNIDKRSLVIIDELGRGTSTRDGLTIAIAIAEALIESEALIWFVTHFRELAHVLSERNGVVNLHLAVDISETRDRMTMLYRITNGCVQEKHYGITMAKVAGLPADVIDVATKVSTRLTQNTERKKKNSKSIALARRRRLILGLREQLKQAQDGNLQGRVLGLWLKQLQDEFVRRMAAIDEEMENLEDDQTVDAAEEEDMNDEDDDGSVNTTKDDASLVRDIPGATTVPLRVYKMSGALPVD
ncbi:MAG: hypothetical protein Q9202_006767 [Teloschistes flavicans]